MKVTIIGGGLGGLVLARVLHVHGIPATVYETDPTPNARAQGGMLDIHVNDGQAALREAGVYEEFLKIIHPGGQATRVLAKDGTVLFDQPDDGTGVRPEVPRGELRRILIESLPTGTVVWGHKVAEVAPIGGCRYAVTFANGATTTSDLLVGADGAWSKVRSLLSEAKPEYAGTTFVETYLFDSDTRHKASAKAVGGGSMMAPARGKGIFVHREPNGVLHTYAILKKPRGWIDGVDFTDRAAAVACLAKEFGGWAPELTALITESDTDPVPRAIHALPAEHRWARVLGVTLVGDAAHLMPPNGEGANLAMFDGAELGKAIAANSGDVEAALAAYENDLFPRSAAVAAQGDLDFLSDDGAPHSLIRFFTQPVG